MKIRKAEIKDADEIRHLFQETVNYINSKDYNQEQISVWVSAGNDTNKWINKISEQHFFVAETGGKITGFASITDKGYLDYMYIHKDFQGMGIGSKLYGILENKAFELKVPEIWAEVSITARPFFAGKGFEITKEFKTRIKDVEFDDCIMTKKLKNMLK